MGVVKVILTVVGAAILALVGLAAYLWFTDHEMEAEVTDKGQDQDGHYVVVTPRLLRFDVKQTLSAEEASFVCTGYRVAYRIQTGYFQVFDDSGTLVYDSEEGLQNLGVILRCGASNAGNGGLLGAAPRV